MSFTNMLRNYRKAPEGFIFVYMALPDPHQQEALVDGYIRKLRGLGYEAKAFEHGMLIERESYEAFQDIRRAEKGI